MDKIYIFVISLILPFIYWRGLFAVASKVFDKPFTRTKTGLQVHHIHFGILLVLVASFILLFQGVNNLSIIFLGLGLGLMLDEFIPSLLLPGDRPLELEVYKKSLSKTAILFIVIVVTLLLIHFAENKF